CPMERRQKRSETSSRTVGKRMSRALDPAFFIDRLRQRGDAYNSKKRVKQWAKKRAKQKEKRPQSTLRGRSQQITAHKEGNFRAVINL
ncbi:MAG: hypothetical protein IJU69_02095, partial [Bacteroidales bacterium]|nr:hypothetical protein [Bacteroidales bacterium]